ncbi:hypothetical protein SAMN05444377_101248 [Flavobacterium fontis]|uniref:Uncharacterized protein n=1 Tax=Flavobacterium fontis TaxID=1124188 RepID=A0A1M4WCF4_9FLAO|nr:hypothetical protein SAMN05444377_101248 [Flavobacterium fontis]
MGFFLFKKLVQKKIKTYFWKKILVFNNSEQLLVHGLLNKVLILKI